jgi:hypothetical protein
MVTLTPQRKSPVPIRLQFSNTEGETGAVPAAKPEACQLPTAVETSQPPDEEVVLSFRTTQAAERFALTLRSRDSSFGIVTRLRAERRNYRVSIPRRGQEMFLLQSL